MSKRLQDFKQHRDAIRRILLEDWDPIGIAAIAEAQDEYDSYVTQICGMVSRRESSQKLFEFLWLLETEQMGLCGNRARTAAVAQRLAGLPDELAGD